MYDGLWSNLEGLLLHFQKICQIIVYFQEVLWYGQAQGDRQLGAMVEFVSAKSERCSQFSAEFVPTVVLSWDFIANSAWSIP